MTEALWAQAETIASQLQDEPAQAESAAQALLQQAKLQSDHELLAHAHRLLARSQHLQGKTGEAIRTLQAAIRFLQRHKLNQPIMQAYDELGSLLYEQLNYYAALDAWLKSLEIATVLQTSHGCIRAYLGVGKVHFAFGDYRKATHFYQMAQSLSLPLQDARLDCEVALNLAASAYRLGEYNKAQAALGQVSLHLLEDLSQPAWEADVLTYNGLLHLHFSRYSVAQELLSQAYQLYRKHRLIGGQGQVMIALARCFTALAQADLAEECLLEAARLSTEHQLLSLGVESHTSLAQLYLEQGQHQSALQHRKLLHALLVGQHQEQGFPLQMSSHARMRLRKIERELETRKIRLRLLALH
ncbi:tetratricopeptide repeat protein [Chitinibacter sp. GC72]|uniref:tetratricopeptide repeat protein n=1 Tax=Chitinibacter sp. GC72 TaxID=1526917 RepID=UPI0012F79B59|nr:tetratricopeptide repeat protein [Chitinibacter sp. GC72]